MSKPVDLAVLPGWLSRLETRTYLSWVYDHLEEAREIRARKDGAWTQGEERSYRLLNGLQVREGPIWEAYEAALEEVNRILRVDAFLSPFPLASSNVHIAEGEGSSQGWHFDTNPVTAVLYLTTQDGGGLEVNQRNGRTARVRTEEGMLLVMRGKDVYHRVLPLLPGERRVACVGNYYTPDDCARDPRLDELLYGRSA